MAVLTCVLVDPELTHRASLDARPIRWLTRRRTFKYARPSLLAPGLKLWAGLAKPSLRALVLRLVDTDAPPGNKRAVTAAEHAFMVCRAVAGPTRHMTGLASNAVEECPTRAVH
jgi:hypothetical protein